MRFLLNLLWLVFGGGFLIAIEYVLIGLLLCLSVVGIPFGVQCFKLAALGLFPFGKELRERPGIKPVGFLLNVLWLICAGIWIFLSHIALALSLAVTLIGIPFAVQHVKFGILALAPFGQEVRVSP